MGDIVERLRDWSDELGCPETVWLLREAADEIERLRAHDCALGAAALWSGWPVVRQPQGYEELRRKVLAEETSDE